MGELLSSLLSLIGTFLSQCVNVVSFIVEVFKYVPNLLLNDIFKELPYFMQYLLGILVWLFVVVVIGKLVKIINLLKQL